MEKLTIYYRKIKDSNSEVNGATPGGDVYGWVILNNQKFDHTSSSLEWLKIDIGNQIRDLGEFIFNFEEEKVTHALCDQDCNNCPIITHPNSRMITKILNKLYDQFPEGIYETVRELCPGLTVCFDCRIDDFCHVEGCELTK